MGAGRAGLCSGGVAGLGQGLAATTARGEIVPIRKASTSGSFVRFACLGKMNFGIRVQWALRPAPSGLVLPITAMTPMVGHPVDLFPRRHRPRRRSLVGGLRAVASVVGLSRAR